ncbi:hypothetical protein [Acidovorax sp.]|uniref:hypothetical protein n=1 Tax=Acidovorax sp. TaxID=1872122 RepID=UPI002ACE9F31|nr:hypothetical protein [Acidovorax sp.]MDZ7862854.1 hypothetical protein [Acidovorax sp.]
MAEHTLAIDNPTGLLAEDVRRQAIAAAEEMLAHKGVTVEQCAAIGTRPTKPVRPGTIPSFFCGMGEVAAAWLEACTVVQDLCGPDVTLRIVNKQAPLPH